MNQSLTLFLAALMPVVTASAQDWAKARLEKSPRHLEWVKVKHDQREVNFATNDKRLKAAFVFYGTAPETEQDLARIACPVYGFYAGNDARVTATVPQAAKLMKKVGKAYEPKTYEGAGHGFMRAGEAPDASAANQQARDAAWQRWLELVKKL